MSESGESALESIEELSPPEKLKQHLLELLKESGPEKVKRSSNEPREAIEGILWITSLLEGLNSDNHVMRRRSEGDLKLLVRECGLTSLGELKTATQGLTKQLKKELPERSWKLYFE